MSANKTSNYNLHSWLPQDEFHLTEINENFAKLDTALQAEAQTAAAGRSSLNTALQSEITTRAQQMATKADKTEVAKKVEVVLGTYVGDGAVQRQITLAKKPTFVHLEIAGGFRYASGYVYGGLATRAVNLGYNCLVINDKGFQLNQPSGGSSDVNDSNQTYIYAAYYL